ncbi:hypothetical protein IU459_15130 [Nocardia amamiensis]|uniref:Secreted protein n=1 Tax=Nocardia amamiensis TaxID=404578 RepID=A0ABS0CQJ4_9NOCA|nr:hypothetical protein [Nocardia amamiensis]MBF6298867.1 hypothetical protein [Nocardia amamiensis]
MRRTTTTARVVLAAAALVSSITGTASAQASAEVVGQRGRAERKKSMLHRKAHHAARWATLVVAATAAFGLTATPASAGQIPDSWWSNTVRFWETTGFSNDGVELGPGAYDLRSVTRDCVIFCWNDWNNVPSSLHVAPHTWLTVWEDEDRQGACVSFWGGEPFEPGGNTPGRAWDNLGNIAAGDSSGNWAKRISYVMVTPVSAYQERPMTACPEAVW